MSKQSDNVLRDICCVLGYEFSVTVSPQGLSGGLAILWRKPIALSVISMSLNLIDTYVEFNGFSFYLSFVYGPPNPMNRDHFWEQLERIAVQRNAPWCLVGDFNAIRNNTEKRGGPIRSQISFRPFCRMINTCQLHDIKSIGDRFSWTGIRQTHRVWCCLDRGLVNKEWVAMFPSALLEYLPFQASDHRPMILKLFQNELQRRRLFRFDKRMFQQEGFKDHILQTWHQTSHINNVNEKVDRCRRSIARWKKIHPTNSADTIRHLQARINANLTHGHSTTAEIQGLQKELQCAYHNEEEYWRLKSRTQWLTSGDRNTKFFYAATKQREARNKILAIQNDDGSYSCGDEEVGRAATNYFQELFQNTNQLSIFADIFSGFHSRITSEMNATLEAPVTNDEIDKAMFSIGPDRAPGPDGFTGSFYQQCWPGICEDIYSEVRQFFSTQMLVQKVNHTHLCLIPKKEIPSTMSDFRPIALCNVRYKIISKILVHRLQTILPAIVSEEQAAFTPGRQIMDNIIVAQELLHSLKSRKRWAKSYMAIKMDISKAYDRIEWSFLHATLMMMGFGNTWISWIMECVQTVTFSVLINGSPQGFITPKRGLRQGDPLSPYLFILCGEVLSHLLHKASLANQLKGMKISRHGPTINHLVFADDTLLFCHANNKSITSISHILRQYEAASRQSINLHKSAITFGSKVQAPIKTMIRHKLNIHNDGGGGKYLGLPEQIGTRKKEIFRYIVDKAEQRTRGWKYKFISDAGKEILLKTVALAMPVYTMNCFNLPKGICEDINNALAKFWWSKGTQQGMHWLSWKRLSLSKQEGGLGFRDIEKFNRALLGKQVWRLMTNPNSLASRLLRDRYHPNCSIMESGVGYKPSYLWRSLQEGKMLLKCGLKCVVGDGTQILFWKDPWLNTIPPRPPRPCVDSGNLPQYVADVITPHNQGWNMEELARVVVAEDVSEIQKIKLNTFASEDIIGWGYTQHGNYTVKSAYRLATQMETIPTRPPRGSCEIKQRIWKQRISPKLKHFLWKLISQTLAVGTILKERRIANNIECRRCCSADESLDHLFFTCSYAQAVWRSLNISSPLFVDRSVSFEAKIQYILQYTQSIGITSFQGQLPYWCLWRLWKSRNCLLYQNKSFTWQQTHQAINRDTTEWSLLYTEMDPPRKAGSNTNQVSINTFWKRPPTGYVKCNYDCGYIDNVRPGTSGWLIRDHNGLFLEAGSSIGNTCSSVLEAECQALLMIMQQAWIKGYRKVIFEGDSQLLHDLVNARTQHFNLHSWVREILHWKLKFTDVSFAWTQRQGNQAADILARSHNDNSLFRYFHYIPRCITTVLSTDYISS